MCTHFFVNTIINSWSIMASWAYFFFSSLFCIYSYIFYTYPEMRAAVWLLGLVYGSSFNLYWVLPPTLLCTCRCHHTHTHAHVHTCTHSLSYTYDHSFMYGQTLWVGCPYWQPAAVTGMRIIVYILMMSFHWYTQFYMIPVPSGGIDARRNRTGNANWKLQEGRTGHVFR